jgi:hypothetical protein
MALSIFMSNIAFILSLPKTLTRWRGNLKGLFQERGWVKYSENLSGSPF